MIIQTRTLWHLLTFVFLVVSVFTASTDALAQNDGGDIPYPDPESAREAAANWLLQAHQNDDGGFTSFSAGANQAESDVGGTIDALIALTAAGVKDSSALDYLEDHADDLAEFAALDGAKAGKSISALVASGEDARNFGGHDFVASLEGFLTPAGDYRIVTAFDQSLAIIGLTDAGQAIPGEAIDWLIALQAEEGDIAGSWDDGFGTAGNADATAMAIMALLAAEVEATDPSIEAAVNFLRNTQLDSGGWEYGAGFGANANSTALVVQALTALGEDIQLTDGPWLKDGKTPVEALLSWQAESGAFQADFGDGLADNFFSTVQALPAVSSAGGTASAESSTFAGGDSILPYVLIGVTVILLAGAALFLYRRR